MCDMTRSYVWHDSCDMTHSYVRHDSCDITYPSVRHDSSICDSSIHETRKTWLIHMWFIHMTHSYVWHDSSICDSSIHETRKTWLIHIYDITHSKVNHIWMSHVYHVVHMDESCLSRLLIYMCDMTHPYVRHDPFKSETRGTRQWSCTTLLHIFSCKHMYIYTHSHILRVEWRGLTAFARRNKACVFRKII